MTEEAKTEAKVTVKLKKYNSREDYEQGNVAETEKLTETISLGGKNNGSS